MATKINGFMKLAVSMALGLTLLISSAAEASSERITDALTKGEAVASLTAKKTGATFLEIRESFDVRDVGAERTDKMMRAFDEAGKKVHGENALKRVERLTRETLAKMGLTPIVSVFHAAPAGRTVMVDSSLSIARPDGTCEVRVRADYAGDGIFAEASEALRLGRDFFSLTQEEADEGVRETAAHEGLHCEVAAKGGLAGIPKMPKETGEVGVLIEEILRERMRWDSNAPTTIAHVEEEDLLEESYVDVASVLRRMGDSPGEAERREAKGRLIKLISFRTKEQAEGPSHRTVEALREALRRLDEAAEATKKRRDEIARETATVGWLKTMQADAERAAARNGTASEGEFAARIAPVSEETMAAARKATGGAKPKAGDVRLLAKKSATEHAQAKIALEVLSKIEVTRKTQDAPSDKPKSDRR